MRRIFRNRAELAAHQGRVLGTGTLALPIGLAIFLLCSAVGRASELTIQNWQRQPLCALWDGHAGEIIARSMDNEHIAS